MSKNVKQLKELLIKQLREHQVDFKLEGEGDDEVITLSRQALESVNSNEELSPLIVECLQSDIKINLLGLANKIINARITRPVFSERTVTIADQQEMMFEMKDGKIDSTKSLKVLNDKYFSEGMKEFDKSTEVRTAGNYRLPMLLTEMNKARATSDELKDKKKELRQELKGEINNGDLVNRFGQEIADLIVEARIAEENGNKEHYFKCFEDAIDILNYGTTKEEAQNAVDSLEVELTEEFYEEVYNVLLPVDLHDKTLSSLKVIVEHSGIEIKYDSALVEAILRVLTSDLDETITLDRVKILLLQDYTLNETIDILESKRTANSPKQLQDAIDNMNSKITNRFVFRREPLFAEEIRDSYFGESIADKIGTSKEEIRKLFDAMWKYNDSHENDDLNSVKEIAEELGLSLIQSSDNLDISYNEEVLISLSLNSEINKKISIVCDCLDRGLRLYPQPVHDDWYINDSDGNPVVIINANEEQVFFEFMREYRHPSIKQFSQLSVDDYCKLFTKLYNSSSSLSTKELYKYLLDNNLDMREVAKIINLETNEPFPVKKILDKLDVYDYTNYELTLFCYFTIGDFTKGIIDRIDESVQDYCDIAGKIDSSFFNTSVVNSRINKIVATAYEETKASYKDLLRIYLKTESVDKYNKELKAYNEVQEKVKKENNLVVKEELIRESKEIMSLANTYKFSETSITNIQVSKLEMEMSNKIYKMAGEKLYYEYFDFISLSCTAGSRRIVYIADKDNAKYGKKTITEEMSKSISLGNTLVEPNRTIVIGMNYNYTLSLTPEYRCKLAGRILRKDVFFDFATDIIDNAKIKDYFEISCRKREANGILIDTVLLSYNDDLVLLRDGEFTSLKDVNYEVFTLIADFMEYGVVACLDTKAYDKIIGFYKRNNYSDSVINKIVNLSKFMNTIYDGFTLNENDMKLIVKKNGVSTVTPINRINYKVNKLVYVK